MDHGDFAVESGGLNGGAGLFDESRVSFKSVDLEGGRLSEGCGEAAVSTTGVYDEAAVDTGGFEQCGGSGLLVRGCGCRGSRGGLGGSG
ncbi:MAG TPA: hypothetical protein DCR20_00535, partial [Planctomycetaceae bacterium]|nr:hypothetical protein [Planctomycetaceae bacterium]